MGAQKTEEEGGRVAEEMKRPPHLVGTGQSDYLANEVVRALGRLPDFPLKKQLAFELQGVQ